MHEIRATIPPEYVEEATRLARSAGMSVSPPRMSTFTVPTHAVRV
jgi:hypothetical protein